MGLLGGGSPMIVGIFARSCPQRDKRFAQTHVQIMAFVHVLAIHLGRARSNHIMLPICPRHNVNPRRLNVPNM